MDGPIAPDREKNGNRDGMLFFSPFDEAGGKKATTSAIPVLLGSSPLALVYLPPCVKEGGREKKSVF